MAHEIDFTNNSKGAAMFADKKAWHGHGTVVSGCQTSDDALRIASMDWDVLTEPLGYLNDGNFVGSDNLNVLRRSDTGAILGTASNRYVPIQNRDAFASVDHGFSANGFATNIWATAGSLKGGRTVFMSALVGKAGVRVNGADDNLENYILATTTHDGSGSFRVYPTSVRVVCANTLNFADSLFKGTNKVTVRHTVGSIKAADKKIEQLIARCLQGFQTFEKHAALLAAKELSSSEFCDYLKEHSVLLSSKESVQRKRYHELLKVARNSRNTGGFGRNAWTAYNTVSEFHDHHGIVRATGGTTRAEAQMTSNLFGTSEGYKAKALAAALALAS